MKAYEYLEDHGILFAGIVLLFLLQSTLLVFLGLSAGLSILVCSIWLLFFTVYFLQDYLRKKRRARLLYETAGVSAA